MWEIVNFGEVSRSDVVSVIKGVSDFSQESLFELLVYFLLDVYVVHPDAGLSTVQIFSKYDSLGCAVYLG